MGLTLGYTNSHSAINLITSLSGATLDVKKNRLEVTVETATTQREVAYVSKRKRQQQLAHPPQRCELRQRFAVVTPSMHHSNLNNINYSVFFQVSRHLNLVIWTHLIWSVGDTCLAYLVSPGIHL